MDRGGRTCVKTTFVPFLSSSPWEGEVCLGLTTAVSVALARQGGIQGVWRGTTVSLQEQDFWAGSGIPDPVEIEELAERRDGSIGGRQCSRGGNDANNNGDGGATRF